MASTCIITDSSVQFTYPGFPGNKCLKIFQHQFSYSPTHEIASTILKVGELPAYTSSSFCPHILPAPREQLAETITASLPYYDDIFILLLSKEINPLYDAVEQLTISLHGHANLHLIDSQNVSLGLGMLVQFTAELLTQGIPADEVEKTIRLQIPHIYSLFCTPNLTYLQSAGMIDSGQATVGEMLNLYPLFVMEEGKLNPMQKVKNPRAAIDYFLEFLDEFDDLRHVAFLQPAPPVINESKQLHQHIEEFFPETKYTEHLLSPFLSTFLGPRGFGMTVMENL